jgi:hypothetical protein
MHMSPQPPQIVRSKTVLIPSLSFLQGAWFEYWNNARRALGYLDKNDRPFNPLGAFCENIAGRAVVEMCHKAGELAGATGIDATAGIFEVRIDIQTESFMGVRRGKEDGNHSTCLVAFTRDGVGYELAFWEPQQDPKEFRYEDFKESLDRVGVYDVLL